MNTGSRSNWFLRLLPRRQSAATGRKIEDLTMAVAARFYSAAQCCSHPILNCARNWSG